MTKITPKMLAKNYFADIMGINLEHALEAYDWEGWNPMTDNGITVTGFWDKSKGIRRLPQYHLPELQGRRRLTQIKYLTQRWK